MPLRHQLTILLIVLLTGCSIATNHKVATSYGIFLEFLGIGPNAESLPETTVTLKKPVFPTHDPLSIDLSNLKSRLATLVITSPRGTYTTAKAILDRIENGINEVNKGISPTGTQRRSKRFGGLLGGFVNLLFGSDDKDYSKSINDLKSSITETNKAVTDLGAEMKTMRNLEKSDVSTLSSQISYEHNHTRVALLELNSALSNLSTDVNRLKDHLSVVESLLYCSVVLENALASIVRYNSLVAITKEKVESIRSFSAAGKLSPVAVPLEALGKAVSDIASSLAKENYGVKHIGNDLKYYYTLSSIKSVEDNENFYFTIPIPITSSSSSLSWYKVHSWPVNAGNLSSGVCVLNLPECIGIPSDTSNKAALFSCGELTKTAYSLDPVTPSVISISSTSKCLRAIERDDVIGAKKECRMGICQLGERYLTRVGPSRYIIHGSQKYTISCGGTIRKSSTCTDCEVSVPCRCQLITNKAESAISFSNCPKVSEVSWSVSSFLVEKFSQGKITVPLAPRYKSRPKVNIPKELNFPVDKKDIAERQHQEFDANKALDSLQQDSKIHLENSDYHAQKAVTDAGIPSGSMNTPVEVAIIVLGIISGFNTVVVVYLLCHRINPVVPLQLGNHTLTVNLITHKREDDKELTIFQIVSLTIASVVSLITVVIAVYKCECRKRRVGANEEEMQERATHLMILGHTIMPLRIETDKKPGDKGKVGVRNNTFMLDGKIYSAPLPNGQYDYVFS